MARHTRHALTTYFMNDGFLACDGVPSTHTNGTRAIGHPQGLSTRYFLRPCGRSRRPVLPQIHRTFRIVACFAVAILTAVGFPRMGYAQGVNGPGFTQSTNPIVGEWVAKFSVIPSPSERVLRTTVMGYHRGWFFTDTRDLVNGGGLQVWNISDLFDVKPAVSPQDSIFDLRRPFHVFFMETERELYINNGAGMGPKLRDFSDMRKIVDATTPWTIRPSLQNRDAFTFPIYYLGQNGYSPFHDPAQIWDARTDTLLAEVDFEGDIGIKGVPIVIGNLMIVASSNGGAGVATYDVSDPANPVLLDVLTTCGITEPYEPAIYGHWVVLTNNRGNQNVTFVDFSDPTNLKIVKNKTIPNVPGNSRYIQFQDHFMFVGEAKYDLRSPAPTYPVATFVDDDLGDEYLLPMGNLLFIAGNTGQINIYAHQSEVDTKGPFVTYTNPVNDSINQAVTTRIGVVIPETLQFQTINRQTFQVIVRGGPCDGDRVSGTLVATDKDIITFTPDQDFYPFTEYEVLLPAGGIKDVSGNGIEQDYSFQFTTGDITPQGAPVVHDIDTSVYPVPVGGSVTLTADATDSEGDLLEYRWDLGGCPPVVTNWSSSRSVTHLFADAGHFDVTLQVRDGQGGITAFRIVVTVQDRPAGPFAQTSGPIICDEANRRVFAVNPDNDTVTAIDADTLAKLWEMPVGARPRGVAQAADGSLWVTCQDDDRIDILDDLTGQTLHTIRLRHGAGPHHILFNPDQTAVYCTMEGSGHLVKINPASPGKVVTLPLGPKPRAMAISGDGARLWVTRFISPADHGQVWEIDTATFTLSGTISLAVDTHPDTSENGRGVPNYLAGIGVSPLGDRAWVASKKDNTQRGEFRDSLPLTPENTVRAIASVIDLNTHQEIIGQRFDFDNTSQMTAVTFSPLGDYLFVTSQGNNEIEVIDAFTHEHVQRITVGRAPQGICFDLKSRRLFTKDFMSRTITAVDIKDFLETGNESFPIAGTIDTAANEKLSAQVLEGKQIFYNAVDPRMSLDSYISCAVCHDDGGQDGRVWDFTDRGEGVRNTITLRAQGGMRNGPVHWTGNFDEIQDFENDIVNRFGGSGFIELGDPHPPLDPLLNEGRSSELDALAEFVTSLTDTRRSPYRKPNGKMTASAIAGRSVFRKAKCANCHSGSTFTDSQIDVRHKVGTATKASGQRLGDRLDGFDTPTLLGLWETAPYFHDGSAKTLLDVINHPKHSRAVAGFSNKRKRQLVSFLLQLERHDDITRKK